MVQRRRFLKIYSLELSDIWQNFYFYRILNNENFKMKVEQTNFVTHLIIIVQLYLTIIPRGRDGCEMVNSQVDA